MAPQVEASWIASSLTLLANDAFEHDDTRLPDVNASAIIEL